MARSITLVAGDGSYAGHAFRGDLTPDLAPDGASLIKVGEVRDGSFDLLRIDIRGDTVLHRPIPYEAVPIPSEALRQIREVFAERQREPVAGLPGRPVPTDRADRLIAALELARHVERAAAEAEERGEAPPDERP